MRIISTGPGISNISCHETIQVTNSFTILDTDRLTPPDVTINAILRTERLSGPLVELMGSELLWQIN